MTEPFLGTWKLVSSENFDEYMKQLGVSAAVQNLAGLTKPRITISADRNKVNIKTESSFRNTEIGLPWWCSGWESACRCRGHGFVPWSGKIPHAAERRIITLDGGSMIHFQKWLGKEITIKRQIVDGKMLVEYIMNNIVSIGIYKKV
ncbi:fatty acid-binding protein 9-like [Pseudorca crassidens]|uniref:fatty acid-binding protein 9-like n=1 Tax=Pseudorca crassidens TaxID=82174 RepID=UPI00352D43B0